MKFYQSFFLIILFFFFGAVHSKAQTINEIKRVSFTVSDLDEAVEFYTRTLPFQKDTFFMLKGENIQQLFNVHDTSLVVKVARLHLGDEQIELMEFHSVENPGRIKH